jgi:glycosyltransferase involved in cell wall biosynthesis
MRLEREAAVAVGAPCPESGAGTAETLHGADRPAAPIRVRTGHSYHVPLTITLGQRNTRFVQRALTPLARLVRWRWVDSMTFLPEPGFDAIHSWNAVPLLTRRPYIVTFEDFLPRTPEDRRIAWLERWLRDRLVEPRCVGIVALSDYAVRQVRRQHHGWSGLPDLLAKICVVPPATPIRRDRPKRHSDRLRLLFVGYDVMRKGGPVVLRAHEILRGRGVPVETTIVSSLGWSADDYVGPPDAAYVQAELARLSQEGVVHHRRQPLAEVHRLMDAADWLVFPTFHDTFGFVTVEALAGGTPVVATDTCVMPEVVIPGETGWLLPFENESEVGKWRWLYCNAESGYLDAYHGATLRLADALADRLTEAWEERRDYQILSAGALAAARARYNPEIARTKLETLYERFREVLS